MELQGDIRYAIRTLAHNPGFTTIVVIMLALGIGANTAIFSIVDHVLLRSLPYPDAGQLVMVYESHAGRADRSVVPTADWLDWQKENRSFQSLAAWGSGEFSWQMNLIGDGHAERLSGQYVSEEFFPLVRVAPALGRLFTKENHRPGASPVVILSYGLWQRRFGGDPSVIGRRIQLEAIPHEVVGVMPPGFHFVWPKTDYWAPLRINPDRDYRVNSGNNLNVVGRLKPSVTAQAAQTEMSLIAGRLADAYPANKGITAKTVPLREELTGDLKTSLWLLFAAVGLLLVIACSNFAGLLLARSANRRSEMTLRVALGATRGAILRQYLAESLTLSLAGGIAGVVVARGILAAIVALVPPDLMEIGRVGIDGRMLLYTLGVSLLTGFVFGLAPAITASRVSLIDALHAGNRATPHTARLRRLLVIGQVALTVVLLCGSILLGRSFRELMRADLGVEAGDVLTMNVGLDGDPYDARGPEYVAFYQQAFERLQSLPGVRSAAAGHAIPVTGRASESAFRIQGEPEVAPSERPRTNLRMVTPGYFRTLGIPILRGRDFNTDDRRDSPRVFIVNQAFVDAWIRGRDPMTSSIAVGNNPYAAIIAVAGNMAEDSVRGRAEPTVFYTYSQIGSSTDMYLFMKAENAAGLAAAAIQAIREIDPNVPVYEVRMLEGVYGESVARDRLNAVVSGAFALSALLLAGSGVYGLLRFHVAERTREIGIRIALGAKSSDVVRGVIGQSLRLILPGLVLGLGGSLVLTRLIESLLYRVSPREPFTFAAVTVLIVGVGVAAAFLPAHRASHVDPLTALRQE